MIPLRQFAPWILVALLSGCFVQPHVRRSTAASVEATVYAVVLDTLRASMMGEQLVVESQARGLAPRGQLNEVLRARLSAMPSLDLRTLEAFTVANAESIDLRTVFRSRVPVLFSTGTPPGSVRLSRVGIGPDGKQALIVVETACGGFCSSATAYLLVAPATGGWRIVGSQPLWIS